MPNTLIPPPPPLPAVVTVQPPEPVRPSTAQVVSAAVQNVVVAGILGAGWLYGKLDTTVAVVALLLVVGIDFAGRKRLSSSTTAAVTFGATGILKVLGVTGTLASVAGALLLGGCAELADILPRVQHGLAAAQEAVSAVCEESSPKCDKARTALDEAAQALNPDAGK